MIQMFGKYQRALTGAAIVAISVLYAAPAIAQTQQQLNWCSGKDGATPELKISGCTAVIQSGRYSGRNLAIVFTIRGNAYRKEGQYDRAIADYDQAIRIDPNLADAYFSRGAAYDEKEQYDRA